MISFIIVVVAILTIYLIVTKLYDNKQKSNDMKNNLVVVPLETFYKLLKEVFENEILSSLDNLNDMNSIFKKRQTEMIINSFSSRLKATDFYRTNIDAKDCSKIIDRITDKMREKYVLNDDLIN